MWRDVRTLHSIIKSKLKLLWPNVGMAVCIYYDVSEWQDRNEILTSKRSNISECFITRYSYCVV